MIEISKEKLEKYVPSFADSTDGVFVQVYDALEEAVEDIISITDNAELDDSLQVIAERAAYKQGCYMAVPMLDLVLTPTGFGVVSNQNVAPASRDRVEKLRESLRQGADNELYRLLSGMRTVNGWSDSCMAREFINRLMWNPMQYRNNGITLDGRSVYREEMGKLSAQMSHAESHVCSIISDDLYAELVLQERRGTLDRDPYLTTAVKARSVIAAHIMHHPESIKLDLDLQRYVEKHAEELPEYRCSTLYAAIHFEVSDNEREDSTYFW